MIPSVWPASACRESGGESHPAYPESHALYDGTLFGTP